MRVYFDNAATTPLTASVKQAMVNVMDDTFGNASSIHNDGRKARTVIENSRKTVAKHLNCSIGEVFFTSCGTESNNTAIKCAVRDLKVTHIITSRLEHHCVLYSIARLAERGEIKVEYVDVDKQGQLDYNHLQDLLRNTSSNKVLVSLMHANNEIGNLLNLQTVSDLCREHGAYFHTDTVQTIGHYLFDLANIHIDFLSGSAHKFHGPKGVGFIYINNNIQIKPYIDGGSQERNMRGGTENVIGIEGLRQAIDDAYVHFEERKAYVQNLKSVFADKLTSIIGEDQIEFNGTGLNEGLYTVLSVAFPDTPKNELIVFNLDIKGISASGGSACSSGVESASHVLEAIDPTDLRKTVRFSFSHLNTLEEVDYVITQIASIL